MMKQILTPGRWRGLMTTSTPEQIFTILAFDQRGSYREMLPDGTRYDEAVQIKNEVIVSLSNHTSAVLLDHEYGLSPALHMSGRCGLLMALEKSGYSGDSTYRRIDFLDEWTVEKIKTMGASAVKMMAYYHPYTSELANDIEATIVSVIGQCHDADIPLFLEPMSYSIDSNISKSSEEFAQTRSEMVIETARRLSQLRPDVLKMEFPIDANFDSDRVRWGAACQELSDVCKVPWVLLSAGVDFDIFVEQVQIACESGASGFLAGRTIWKEAIYMDVADRLRFLEEVAVPRAKKLSAIAQKQARPWTDFYEMSAIDIDWYVHYLSTSS